MSNTVITWALNARTRGSSDKLILLVMANYSDDDGSCWPSQAKLAADSRLNPKTITAGLKRLTDDGWIVDTGARKGHTGQIVIYRMVLSQTERATVSPPLPKAERTPKPGSFRKAERTPILPAKDTVFSDKAPQFYRERTPKLGDGYFTDTSIEPSVDTPMGKQADPPTEKVRATRLPRDWHPGPAERDFAVSRNIDPDESAAEFRDYWSGVPGHRGVKTDWPATYRNHIRRLIGNRPGPQSSLTLLTVARPQRMTEHERVMRAAGLDANGKLLPADQRRTA